MSGYLLDVNVLVPILFSRSDDLGSIGTWYESISGRDMIGVCRVAQMAALRILTTTSAMGADVLRPREFWFAYDTTMASHLFCFVEEPGIFEETWRELTMQLPKGMRAETDAYLVSLSKSLGRTLVTRDRGMARFGDRSILILD